MADGDYERRAARDAELKRLERMLEEARRATAERRSSALPNPHDAAVKSRGEKPLTSLGPLRPLKPLDLT